MKYLFQRANVLTMKTDEILYLTDVLVEKGIIVNIGKNIPAENAITIDCTGKYLIPGLFDAHAHLNTSEMGELFIANGITGVRNLCGTAEHNVLDSEIRDGTKIGPYIYSSGPIIDGVKAIDKVDNRVYISSLQEAEEAVYNTINDGFRWVKTYPSIEPDHLQRLMETARDCGIKVCGHMSYPVDAKTLCDWGYHCCEHSSSLPRHDADIEYLAKGGMWFCPTQVVCETLPDYVWNGKQLNDLAYYEYVPGPLREFWEDRNKKIIAGYKKRDLRPDINVVINRGKTFMTYSDQYLAGSDTMYPGIICGFSLHEELYKLVTLYGRTPYEALKSATVNPAKYIGLEEEKGMLRKGFDADLVILDENPLANIRNTNKIQAVMQGTRYYDRKQLDAILNHVRNLKDEEFHFIAPIF
ncbi:MAG: amidohydrolase family protein [Anaerolineaceae bacterium]|nr:amidohydrolase family protein [Anaerolineaceae bacterium]